MNESKPKSNLALRLMTAAVTAPFIIYMLFWGPGWLFPAVTGFVALLGAWELFGMIAPRHPHQRVWGTLASAITFALVGLVGEARWFALGAIALTCGGMLISLFKPKPLETAALRMGWTVAGPLYVGALFAALVLLFRREEYGGSWVLLALLCGFISDTAGYFVGRAYGKRPLNATVSPKKTIEGSLGGLAGGVVSGVVAHFWFLPVLPLFDALWLSLLATAAGQAGDLCESLIKRSVGVKDSGTILPGHGGVMDRSDAMLFSGAAIWAYVFVMLG
jgi:phosphatidate cytidylyltransferase